MKRRETVVTICSSPDVPKPNTEECSNSKVAFASKCMESTETRNSGFVPCFFFSFFSYVLATDNSSYNTV